MTQSVLQVPGRDPLVVAFYLPQFHPIPENDAWWGAGFTEWRNVVRATPEFEGHYQPHLPGELGFYDLRVAETRVAQAQLAKRFGVDAFCYYHYWFSGRRILERPFEEVLNSGSPDFPFCLAWANEPWTRNWDGGSQEVLLAQSYTDEDHDNHIQYLIRAFRDTRYLRVDGRPVFLIYNPKHIPDFNAVVERWRNRCIAEGVGDPLFIVFETFGFINSDPAEFGCDAAAEFLPHGIDRYAAKFTNHEPAIQNNYVFDYEQVSQGHLAYERPTWTHMRCIVPNWDNTARKKKVWSVILRGSTPELFRAWAAGTLQQAKAEGTPLVFVNAWNEWAEGTHLEPDLRYGRAYLEALASARGIDTSAPYEAPSPITAPLPDTLPSILNEVVLLRRRVAELELSSTKFFAAGEASAHQDHAQLVARLRELESRATPPAPNSIVPGNRIRRVRHILKNDPRPGFRYLPRGQNLIDD